MKKTIILLFILGILILPMIYAKNIEVIIEHKQPETQQKSFSIQNQEYKKYEIKTITEEEFEQLKKDKSILIQENIPKRILLDASVPLIQANQVWNIQQNSTNITGELQTICILDTGAQTNHPSLLGKNATCNIDCVTDPNNCIENCSKTDPNGHGTHVAGIIASTHTTYKGTTLNTKYIPIMVCDSDGNCPNDAVLTGLDWCIENKDNYNITIISMSLGGGQYTSYCDATFSLDTQRINNATAKNITIVAATGNIDVPNGITNNTDGISNPACIQNSTRVGNTNDLDEMAESGLRHNFFTDIITAPGVSISSTYPTSTYASMTGTSMSTPHVSGIISLINQYKKLESNKTLTPQEIKQIILNSGKTIYDSESNQNYTRINAYQTILYSDELSPNIESQPNENLIQTIRNQTFFCNATDNLQLKNLTLQIYNSTGLFYSTTNSSPTNSVLTINETINLETPDTYTWNCESYDNQSNYNETENKTITTYSLYAQIESPENNTYTTQNETNFNCSAYSSEELSSITIYIYNSTNLLHNETKTITGSENYSTFEYNLTQETTYFYNCLAQNNISQTYQTENNTITLDQTTPTIELTSPQNNTRTETKTHTFTYTTNETNPTCNLTLNNQNYSTFTQTLVDGTYYWNVTCADQANNTNTSTTFKLEIYTEETSSGGGGGGNPTPITYTIPEEETKEGATQQIKEKESIKIKINSQTHKITLNKIEENKANITIESNPITTTIYLNSPLKIDIDSDGTLDLEIILTGINKYATFFIKEINEIIPPKHILTNKTIEEEKEINLTTRIQKFEEPQKETIFKKIKNTIINLFKRIFKI